MRDPLANPATLIRRVYAYVAYRIGDGHDAEDVTSTTIERALRYRSSYDPRKGDPPSWLVGIARTCVNDHLRERTAMSPLSEEHAESGSLETEVVRRLTVAEAVATLDARDQDLIALRYGADLSTQEIARLLEMRPNAVDVALHRTRERLRAELTQLDEAISRPAPAVVARRPAPEASA
jgi:RNA polymerase sigma-70 factor (ECF subfamily)